MATLPDPFVLIVLLGLLALVPFIAIMVTSFLKLVVVFSLLRNALGVQQIPPNMALNGLALILSLYIMAPVGFEIHDALVEKRLDLRDPGAVPVLLASGAEPLRRFLLKHSQPEDRDFFLRTTHSLWPAERARQVGQDHLLILVPAFTVGQISSAFEVGFLIYLPFIAIDLIVSNILAAMGMMMVSPLTISIPFKLLLFVLLDGWSRLIYGLVLSYQ